MRYLRIWADTYSTGVIDDIGRSVAQHETTISDVTWLALQQWVADYDFVIPLGPGQRERFRPEIDALDRRGMDLTEQIRNEWRVDLSTGQMLSIQYYSEGRQQYLHGGPDGKP